jgi:2-amino-4-hydroxy-6-hydroxymethyldihydropteridine diphosphokinase
MKTCAEMLRKHFPDILFSGVYQTAARDVRDQDDFLNAVGKLETDLTPEELYAHLLTIENILKKNPPYSKGPRTIDLDILLYGDTKYEIQNTKYSLHIPHPRMQDRRFVLEPLCELSDDPIWKRALQKTLNQSCQKIDLSL